MNVPMTWVSLAFIAPLCYAASNFIDRFLVVKRIRDPRFVAVLGGVFTTVLGFAVWVWRGFPVLPPLPAVLLLGTGFAAQLALLPWYKAIQLDDASRVIPFYQLIPVVTLIAAYLFLGERLALVQVIGSALVIGGGLALSLERNFWETFHLRRSFGYILLSVPMFSASAIAFKYVVVDSNFWDTLAYEMLGAGIGATLLFVVFRRSVVRGVRNVQGGTWGLLATNELVYTLGRFVGFSAYALGPVSLVSVIGGVQPFYVLVAGTLLSAFFPRFIREDTSRSTLLLKVVSILVIFTGLVLIGG